MKKTNLIQKNLNVFIIWACIFLASYIFFGIKGFGVALVVFAVNQAL